jgi:hypothetical protein
LISRPSDIKSTFKKCPACAFDWLTRDNFLKDPLVVIIGYQAHFEDLKSGLFLFNHHSCKGTLSIHAGAFTDLYDGTVFSERATGGEQCPGYCLHQNELRPCPAKCECAYVRQVIQLIKNWPKSSNLPPFTNHNAS